MHKIVLLIVAVLALGFAATASAEGWYEPKPVPVEPVVPPVVPPLPEPTPGPEECNKGIGKDGKPGNDACGVEVVTTPAPRLAPITPSTVTPPVAVASLPPVTVVRTVTRTVEKIVPKTVIKYRTRTITKTRTIVKPVTVTKTKIVYVTRKVKVCPEGTRMHNGVCRAKVQASG